MSNELLGVIGTIISLLLMANAYYFRTIHIDLQDIKVKFATIITEKTFMGRSIEVNEKTSRGNSKEIQEIRERLHSIEGAVSQLRSYLKEN